MKPAVLKILTFSFLLIAAVTSCKKSTTDTDKPPAPKTKTILLTQSTWKVQSVALDPNKDGVADTDVTAFFGGCKLDNVYTFKTDGSGTMDEGAAKCNAGDPQAQPFAWLFKTSETILSGNFSFNNGDATIITMSETTLVVAYDDAGTGNHVLATLKH